MTYQIADLDSLRQKIDDLDNKIHDLLMTRAGLIDSILAEKKKHGVAVVQPGREAMMIRRLLARHQGPLPREAVVRIWRELVGAVSLLQTGLSVVIAGNDDGPNSLADLARDYFGSLLPLARVNNAVAALSQLREGKTSFAVVPWPDVEDEHPWWALLSEGNNNGIRIVQSLPFGYGTPSGTSGPRALVLTKSSFSATGDDHSFLLITTEGGLSRAGVMDRLKRAGQKPVAVYGGVAASGYATRTVCLAEIEDYVGDEDTDVIEAIAEQMKDYGASVTPVGGFPTPPIYSAFRSKPSAPEKKTKVAQSA